MDLALRSPSLKANGRKEVPHRKNATIDLPGVQAGFESLLMREDSWIDFSPPGGMLEAGRPGGKRHAPDRRREGQELPGHKPS
jgi:hypothetical protein